MSPVGPPTSVTDRPRISHLIAAGLAFALIAAVTLTLLGGGSAAAETVSFLPSAASCSNSTETDDTPAACSASGATMAPGGGVAIVENDNKGESNGDDDLNVTFNLAGLDASRVTGASIEIGSSQSGDGGVIQVGGPAISDTNWGGLN
ncbi:MAG: hypothetical protein O3A10_16455 [Chloroflexi bacterium]|nr:hypothetical protein [Chloroflexota bacterium]